MATTIRIDDELKARVAAVAARAQGEPVSKPASRKFSN